MSDIITTLHPENDENTNLYPNIKKENIPDGSVDEYKLSESVNNTLANAIASITQPKYYSTLPTSDVGLIVYSDGYIYSWNGSAYTSTGIQYQATQIEDGSIDYSKLDLDFIKSLFDFTEKSFNKKLVNSSISNTGSIITYGTATLYRYLVDSNVKYAYINASLYAANTGYSHYLFEDYLGNVISHKSPASSAEYTKAYNSIVAIPSDAHYMYICIYSGSVTFANNILTNNYDTVTLNASRELLDDIIDLYDMVAISGNSNSAISNTGNINIYGTATVYKYNVSELKFIRINASLYAPNSEYSHYLFEDSSGNVISHKSPTGSTYYTTSYNEYILIPDNAEYMFVCLASGSVKSTLKNYNYKYNTDILSILNNGLTDIVYEDFTNKEDGYVLNGDSLDTNQTWNITGTAFNKCQVVSGKLINNDGNFYMSVNRNNVNYIELKFGFVTTATVVLILQVGNSLSEMIHAEFSNTRLRLSYRKPSYSEFFTDYITLYGNGSYTTELNTEYTVRMWFDGNKVYIEKPDGTLFVTQHDIFNKIYNYSTWQIYESNGNAYFTKLSSGNYLSGDSYEIANKIKNM